MRFWLSLLLLAAGISALSVLWDYSNGPGLPALAKATWPENSHLERDAKNPTFVMFAYPHCACSEASMAELSQITTKITSKLNIIIVFVIGKKSGDSWKETTLYSAAKLIPDAQIILDKEGLEAKRFGARTSGQVLLYDKQGKLVFSGGITPARGRLGENPGKASVIALMNGGRVEQPTAPVFGCAL